MLAKYYKIILYVACMLFLALLGWFILFYGMKLSKDDSMNLWGTVFVSIGASIFAAIIVEVLDKIKSWIKGDIIDKYTNVIVDAGIVSAKEYRDNEDYTFLVKKSFKRILVTGYSLNAFLDSHSEELLRKSNKNFFEVKILIVNPCCEAAKHQEAIEGKKSGHFKLCVERLLSEFSGTNIEIKYIDRALPTMIFCIDDCLFIGPHFSKPSKATLTLELSSKGWMYEAYLNEFESLWKNALDANKLKLDSC